MIDEEQHSDEPKANVIRREKSSVVVKARERSGRSGLDFGDSGRARQREPGIVDPEAMAICLRLRKLLGEEPSHIAFTGLERGVGVSTTATEVARAMAESRWASVLLVDANLADPTLSGRLAAEPGPGLSDLIVGDATLDDVVQELRPGSLYFLSAGTARANQSSLLTTAMSGEVFRSLRLHFETVVTDTAPIGSSLDAKVVANLAQYVALVVQKGLHGRSELEQLQKELSAIGDCRLGVILSERNDGA